MIRAAIIGGSGFTGGELLRLLHFHPEVEVTQITTDTKPIEFVDSIIKDYTYYTQQL